jgi:hypothetical protein
MKLVLDTGALLALERNDRPMWRRFKAALLAGEPARTHGGVIGQAWRGKGARQALLAKALGGVDVRPLDERLGRAAGSLLAVTRRDDVIDAAVVLVAEDGDVIVTSDHRDIEPLARAAGRHIEIVTA